jgi:hypothetical protein
MITPSNFKGDPYGWATNQIGHAFLVGAVLLTFAPTFVCLMIGGAFPPKWALMAFAAVLYLAFELVSQGWHGADTVEDWVFVVVYGSAGSIRSFSEIAPGNPNASFDLMAAAPFILVISLHLLFGAWLRWRQ